MPPSSCPNVITCLTPPGAGAIATLAVQGPGAWPITRSLFQTRLPEQPIAGQFYFGRLGVAAHACDDVVLALKSDGLELHCHGGVEVVRFIQDLYSERGFRLCSWTDLPVTGTPYSKLARAQLLYAPTVKTAAILLDQLHGAYDRALAEIQAHRQNKDHAAATRILARLAQTQHLGRHLVEPFRVVLAGPPNVGKSSIVNALAGYTRSVVSPVPGTTRDVVTTRIALAGWPVELADTAGFHAGGDVLENVGMERARGVLAGADLNLWVLDASAMPLRPPSGVRFHGAIVNKVDLPTIWRQDEVGTFAPARVSAKTGEGVPELCQRIETLLGLDLALIPGEAVAFTPELGEDVRALLAVCAQPDPSET